MGLFTVLRHGGPDADPNLDLLPGVAHDRARHQHADPLPQLSQLRIVDGVRQDDELLASPASREIPDADAARDGRGYRAQRGVPGFVAMLVVHHLEVIDVHEQQPERPPVSMEVLDAPFQAEVELATVGEARERVGQGIVACAGRLSTRIDQPRRIVEDLDGPADVPIGVMDRCGPHTHRDAMAIVVAQPHLGLAGCVIADGLGQRADGAAELHTGPIHVGQDVVGAPSPDDLIGSVPRDALGAMVPVLDAAAPVHVVHAVGEMVDERLVEGVVERGLRVTGSRPPAVLRRRGGRSWSSRRVGHHTAVRVGAEVSTPPNTDGPNRSPHHRP